MRQDLKLARDAEERRSLVIAVGNAAQAEDVTLLGNYAKDEDASVRRAVALSLGVQNSKAARAELFPMTSDADASVQRAALSVLGRAKLESSELDTLAAAAKQGSLHRESLPILVNTLLTRLDGGAKVEEALRAVLERTDADPELQAKVRSALERKRS